MSPNKFAWFAVLACGGFVHLAAGAVIPERPPENPPEWLAPFRLRYTLVVGGDRTKSTASSVIAVLPTGGRLRPDAADVAVQTDKGEPLSVTVLSHDPLGNTVIQFPRKGNAMWYFAYAVAGGAKLPTAPPLPDKAAQEGLIVEVRRWVGEHLDSWASVREGLASSDNVIGNAVVSEVIENCNPVRPNDPRNYASSYRGYLDIPTDGVYRFFINSEDAAFLFIDGFKVTERVGTNARVTGAVKIHQIGDAFELAAGVHPFEIHHVMGNNPDAIGYCALMWAPPDGKGWTFVPSKHFVPADIARVAKVDEAEDRPAPLFAFGIDDTLRSGDGGMVYLVRFEAIGPIGNEKALKWDFGDGTTGVGTRPMHVYFESRDYEVTLTSGALPPSRATVHIWPVPGNTSPLSLGAAMTSLAASDWATFDTERLNRMFQFLIVCEQPERWPLIDAVTSKLLTQPNLDVKQRVDIQRTRMTALAQQGLADEAIALGQHMLEEHGRVPSLQVGIRLAIADIFHRHLKKPDDAAAVYEQIVNENRRLEHPDVRVAAIRWGDLFAEIGNLRRAGECYRLAKALGGEAFEGSTLTADITRGGLLRTAEQKLRAGDLQQTLHLLQRIELHYPEEKLEGLYRVLRADADRRTGHYEEALRNYEILLQLTQWTGFHDRALHGLADTYFRLGEFDKALTWLDSLEKSYPRAFDSEQGAELRKLIVDQQAHQAPSKDTAKPVAASGTDVVFSFEADDAPAFTQVEHMELGPGLGIDGPHVGVCTGSPVYPGSFDATFNIPDVPGGLYWVELWYRETMAPKMRDPQIHMWLRDKDDLRKAVCEGRARIDRTFGLWRETGHLVRVPRTVTAGGATISVRNFAGIAEIDGFRIRSVTDRQADALNNFLKGSEGE